MPLAENIARIQQNIANAALAAGSFNESIHLGSFLDQILISDLLVFEAAHKSAAGTGDLCGV